MICNCFSFSINGKKTLYMPTLNETTNDIKFLLKDSDFYSINLNRVIGSKKTIDIIFKDIFPVLRKEDVNILLFKSGTSSGKSSVFINGLYEYMKDEKGQKGILLTQPKVALARNKIDDLPKYYKDLVPGKTLELKTGKDEIEIKDRSKPFIRVCTTQIFNNYYIYNRNELTKFKYVVVDEVHETSVEMIMLLKNIKSMIKDFKDGIINYLPFFILMSATLDVDRMVDYFELNRGFNALIIESKKKSTNMSTDIYNERVIGDNTLIAELKYIVKESTSKMIKHGWIDSNCKDILIFVSGNVDRICRDLQSEIAKDEELKEIKYLILPGAASDMNENGKSYIELLKPSSDKIRILVATNVLESGATFPSFRICIDTGYRKRKIPFIAAGIPSELMTTIISKDAFTQRKGRIGRTSFGLFYGTYTKKVSDLFDKDDIPSIYLDSGTSTNFELFASNSNIKAFNPTSVQDFIYFMCSKTSINNPLAGSDYLFDLSPEIINYKFVKLYQMNLLDRNGNPTFYSSLLGDMNLASLLTFLWNTEEINIFDLSILEEIFTYNLEYAEIDEIYAINTFSYNEWLDRYFYHHNKVNDFKSFINELVILFGKTDEWNGYFSELVMYATNFVMQFANFDAKNSIFIGDSENRQHLIERVVEAALVI